MEFSNAVVIDRPRQDVFDFLADLENVPKWNYAIVETRRVRGGPAEVGATFRQVRSLPARSEETLEIAELEPGWRLVVRGDLGPFSGTLTYDLEDLSEGTLVANTADLHGRGIMRIGAAIATARVRKAVAENLRTLKDLLERETQT